MNCIIKKTKGEIKLKNVKQIGNLRLKHVENTDAISVYNNENEYIGEIYEQDILKLARREPKTSVRMNISLKHELNKLRDSDQPTINDVIRSLKREHDKTKEEMK